MAYYTDVEEILKNYVWNQKIPRIPSAMLSKKNKVRGVTIPDIKLYCKTTVIKIVWY